MADVVTHAELAQVEQKFTALANHLDALRHQIEQVAEALRVARDEVTKDLALIRSDGQRQLDNLRDAVQALKARGVP